MQRDHWKDLMEIIGGAAIIGSLIFVGMETRNSALQAELNTRALEITAYQDLIDNISQRNILTIESPEVAALMYKAYETSDKLTELEEFRVTRAFYLRLRHGDMAFFQYERGAIDESQLRSVLAPLNLGEPRVQVFWERVQENFADGYRHYINTRIKEINSSR
jgi:hypothetical protein